LEPGTINPLVIDVLQEIGIDISKNGTQRVFDIWKSGQMFQFVITVCSEAEAESCPIFPSVTTRLHWPFDDPSKFTGTHENGWRKRVASATRFKPRSIRSAASTASRRRHEKTPTAELIGTFALVFAGTGAIVINETSGGAVTHVGVALTFGLVVLAMIYSVGDISGAHLNPAVTLGFVAARRFPLGSAMGYIASQCVGAFSASGVLRLLFPQNVTLGTTVPAGSAIQSFVLELILTAILMFTILGVSTGAAEKGITAGIVVGAVIGLEAMFAGPICGASMNPARSLAPAVVSGHTSSLWIYIIAPIVGALVGVIGCRAVREEGCCFSDQESSQAKRKRRYEYQGV
jgi:Glycerol uptake facilitator and related permeases (Major Intrinsic Protein Family)